MAPPPFRTTRMDDSIRGAMEAWMKTPRQSFAEVAWLYQNDDGKAMVISKGDFEGLRLVAVARNRK
jgi:hypothetical protein